MSVNRSTDASDPYNLERFVRAQRDVYAQALAEVRAGRKKSHWMWYVFPQLDGLGTSSTARHYALQNAAEAAAYLKHPLLGPRLHECCEAAQDVTGRSAHDIFGFPDELKLQSCLTLFAFVSPSDSIFAKLLNRYYDGVTDEKTLQLLRATPER